MSKYYMLECFPPEDMEDSALFKRAPCPPGVESWTLGRRFPALVSEPLEFRLQARHSDQLLEMNNTEALIMTRRLLTALREAGVDNLDAYDAVIIHERTGKVYHDYVAVNVVGLVSAADLKNSTVVGGSPGGLIDVDFDSVFLDESRTDNAMMFRLAESTNAIVVHEIVKDHLLSKGFQMLSFVDPKDWMG